jgi:ABC transport system ATP-binding/permease protein
MKPFRERNPIIIGSMLSESSRWTLRASLVADDRAGRVDSQPVVSDIDCLTARVIGLTLPNGRALLSNISFSARPGSLTAIIGPSGAGKTTLAKLVGGAIPPSTGAVLFDGHDVHAEYASLRHRIGLVPQDDVVHHQLTLDAALRFAAELRLPDATAQHRAEAVSRVLQELELTNHAHTRVDKLSGGQRKRASVAMELLTEPALLILDEPTTGLDPALDRQVMSMLRRLADAGRIVLDG